MLKIGDLQGKKVFVVKKARKRQDKDKAKAKVEEDALDEEDEPDEDDESDDDQALDEGIKPGERLAKIGKVHMAVFSPDGFRMIGFLVKRPDIAGMVKRDDLFLAYDSFAPCSKGIRVTRGDDAFDDKARKRLGVDWDRCIMWAGMDAVTESGKELGYVGDAEFNETTSAVSKFLVGDGGMANALVGSLEIPPKLVVGYSKGRMVVKDEAAKLELNGGLAAKAGEATARAKMKSAEFGKKAGKATSEAVDKGSYALGKAIGKAQRAVREAQEDNEEKREAAQPKLPDVEAEAVRVSEPTPELRAADSKRSSSGKPKTYAPSGKPVPASTAKKQAAKSTKKPAKKAPTAGEQAARAVGRGLGSLNKMFSEFKDEFDEASK